MLCPHREYESTLRGKETDACLDVQQAFAQCHNSLQHILFGGIYSLNTFICKCGSTSLTNHCARCHYEEVFYRIIPVSYSKSGQPLLCLCSRLTIHLYVKPLLADLYSGLPWQRSSSHEAWLEEGRIRCICIHTTHPQEVT